jgi:holo-[acyl-carrier protein] synthase
MGIIGTGIDIISIGRLREKIEKRNGLTEKLFTEKELEYFSTKKNYIQNMAGRFAAKEAVYKVMCEYIDGLYWKDIEIESNGSKPIISTDCRLGRYIQENGFQCSVSISHENEYAVAYAVFWKD